MTGPTPTDKVSIAAQIAGLIDHTLLKPEATRADIERLCAEARQYRFASVCCHPIWVPAAVVALGDCSIPVCTVVGFPLGATYVEAKVLEAGRALEAGAREIDMVLPIGVLKEGDTDTVQRHIESVASICRSDHAVCKVILETALLTDEEKRTACRIAVRAGAHFVKTSTGFGPGGATVADVALMAAEVAGTGLGVKAAGGIRTFEDARQMVAAGATRIGASAGVRIVTEAAAVRADER